MLWESCAANHSH